MLEALHEWNAERARLQTRIRELEAELGKVREEIADYKTIHENATDGRSVINFAVADEARRAALLEAVALGEVCRSKAGGNDKGIGALLHELRRMADENKPNKEG